MAEQPKNVVKINGHEITEGYHIYVRLVIKPEKEKDFIEAFKTLKDATDKEPGCLVYRLSKDAYESNVFYVYEIYKNEDAFKAHFASEHFKAAGPALGQCT